MWPSALNKIWRRLLREGWVVLPRRRAPRRRLPHWIDQRIGRMIPKQRLTRQAGRVSTRHCRILRRRRLCRCLASAWRMRWLRCAVGGIEAAVEVELRMLIRLMPLRRLLP